MDSIASGFDHVPPFQVHAPPMPGYYRPMLQAPYNVNMAPMHPPQMGMAVGMGMPPGFCQPGWQPQTVFPIPQWIPFVGPGMGQHQAAAAVDGGTAFGAGQAHRTPDLNARADDILKDTLKKGKELGLSQREVLEHLQSKYSGINWTAYFLENAVLPGSKSDTATRSVPSSCADTSGSQATTSADEPAQKKRRTTTRNPSGRPRGRPRGRTVPAFQPNVPVPSSSRGDHSVAPSLSTASSGTRASTDRPKRGGKLDEFNHETYIPPFDKSSKPVVPRRDPGDDLGRFSTEEKMFFIHYLKWRLREGRLPSKVTLLAELAKELPHHDAEAWKKHWNKDAMLPDDIYSAARKRAIDEELFSSDSDTASTLTPAPETDDEYRPSSPRQASPVPPQSPLATPIPSSVNQKVTEDDLRAMALYMVEKRDVWAQYKTRSHRWEEFSRRKENLKRRSHGGWCNVEWRHAAEIRKLYEEYLVEKQHSEMEDERDEGLTRSLVYPTEHIEEPAARAAESSGFVNVEVKREYIEVDSD